MIAASVGIAAVLIIAGYLIGRGTFWPALILAVLVVGFTLYFFRDPSRQPPAGADNLILAPADGKVVEIVTEHEPTYVKGMATRISIFLSPLNVHVNRVPTTGVIEQVSYIPGDYLVAWHPKASEKNERSEIGMRHQSGIRVLFKQIAGAVARRIVYHIEPGDTVEAGERFGIVKFGSRMDIIIKSEAFEVRTMVGDRVRAGESIIGALVLPLTEAD